MSSKDLGGTCNNEINTIIPRFTPANCIFQISFLPHLLSSSMWVHRRGRKSLYRPHMSAPQPLPPSLFSAKITEPQRRAAWSCQSAPCPLEGTVTSMPSTDPLQLASQLLSHHWGCFLLWEMWQVGRNTGFSIKQSCVWVLSLTLSSSVTLGIIQALWASIFLICKMGTITLTLQCNCEDQIR